MSILEQNSQHHDAAELMIYFLANFSRWAMDDDTRADVLASIAINLSGGKV